jgi:hypothetical protein
MGVLYDEVAVVDGWLLNIHYFTAAVLGRRQAAAVSRSCGGSPVTESRTRESPIRSSGLF